MDKTFKVKATADLLHDELGRITKGQEFEATDAQLSGIKNFVSGYKTKVIHEAPEDGDISADKDASKAGASRHKPGRRA